MDKVKNCIKLMRVKHYIKNVLIFLPLIFSLNFNNFQMDIRVFLGFIAFSLTCSIVYIINDIQDVEKDKQHPVKCKRPIASGKISKKEALILALILFIITTIICVQSKFDYNSILILGTYLVINILYSKVLKNIPLIDVVVLVACYVLRVLFGATLIGVSVSHWLYLTIISFAFYLALGKRRNEMTKSMENGTETRKVLKYYTKDFLDKNMYMCLALTIVFYSLWCVDEVTITKFDINYLIWTIPLLIIICMKYSLNIEGNSYGDPVDVILSDKILIILILIYCIFMGCLVFNIV